MNVLVACEFSGAVRDAFRRAGHDAWSCDILPAEKSRFSRYHYQLDACQVLKQTRGKWDLLIAHPPCTYLCNSGVRWLFGGKGTRRDLVRWAKMEKAAEFFKRMQDARVDMKAIENPIMHKYGRALIHPWAQQTIQPWMFGHGETKATVLHLHGLPPLTPTKVVSGRVARVHLASPGPNRWKERSITYSGIADAMASQWGVL